MCWESKIIFNLKVWRFEHRPQIKKLKLYSVFLQKQAVFCVITLQNHVRLSNMKVLSSSTWILPNGCRLESSPPALQLININDQVNSWLRDSSFRVQPSSPSSRGMRGTKRMKSRQIKHKRRSGLEWKSCSSECTPDLQITLFSPAGLTLKAVLGSEFCALFTSLTGTREKLHKRVN